MNFPDLIVATMILSLRDDKKNSESATVSSVLDAPYIVQGLGNPSHSCSSTRVSDLWPLLYSCLLCDQVGLTDDDVHCHCEGTVHQKNLDKLVIDKKRTISVLEAGIASTNHRRW